MGQAFGAYHNHGVGLYFLCESAHEEGPQRPTYREGWGGLGFTGPASRVLGLGFRDLRVRRTPEMQKLATATGR